MSKRELSKQVGVSPSAIAHWARGTHVPNAHDLANFVRVAGVSGHWLLTGEGSPSRPITAATPLVPGATSARRAPIDPAEVEAEAFNDILHLVKKLEHLTREVASSKLLGAHDRRRPRLTPESDGNLRTAVALARNGE